MKLTASGLFLAVALLAFSSLSLANGVCPTVVVTAPFSDSGSLCGQGDDCGVSAGEDIVYEITIPYAAYWGFDIIETGNDYFYGILEYGTSCCASDLNESFNYARCTWHEAGVIFVSLNSYDQYYCPDYSISVQECRPCEISCPAGAGVSADSVCLWNPGFEPDTINGGFWYWDNCSFYYDELGCDTVLCAFTGFVDTEFTYHPERDWYHITIDESNPHFTMWAVGESAIWASLVRLNGPDYCQSEWHRIFEERGAVECETLRVDACLDPGDYFLEIQGGWGDFGPQPCNTPYVLGIECGAECPPCPCLETENTWCFHFEGEEGEISDYDNYFEFEIPVEYIITDIDFCIDAENFNDLEEVEIELVSPSGQWIELFDNDELDGENLICTRFDDEASVDIDDGNPSYTGSFRPEDELSWFDGENAKGFWTLYIYDDDYDEAYLNWFCITFEYDRILPVELIGFDAIAGDRTVALNWQTASEADNDYFRIVRDGTVVGQIDANNSAAGSSYNWTDTGLSNGRSYEYSLIAVSVSGSSEQLATASAAPTATASTISEYALHQNYPNPFNPETNIIFDIVEAGNVTLTVYNATGQTVATLVNGAMTSGRHSVSFDAASLPSGLYFYRLDAGDFSAVKKMVLMK